MEIFIKLSQFLLSLSLLVILHELGHFIPAKLFKTKVEKFYLFFDIKFALLKKKFGETEYGIGWLPLGGYVKISGMIDESMDKEQMALPPQPWEFRSKPAWQRIIIMLGGVTVNFVLAFVVYIGIAWVYGDLELKNSELKDGIAVTSPLGEELGLKSGDKIVSINGDKIINFNDVSNKLLFGKEVVVNRNGKDTTIVFPEDLIGRIISSKKESLVSLRQPFLVDQVPDTSANKGNLKTKDVIKSLNGQQIKYFDEFVTFAKNNKNKIVKAIVIRDKKEIAVKLNINKDGALGIIKGGYDFKSLEALGYYKFDEKNYSFLEAIPVGLMKGKLKLLDYFDQLKAIFTPKTGAIKGVGGFYAIFNIFPPSWSWLAFWEITAILSIMLGVVNLLPIPALDGGHVMFLLYEVISGKKPSDKFLEKAQIVGFVILMALVLFSNGNDIFKAVFGK
jgi:regulator of sigma E protease